jgi:hypothetical protein
MFHNAIRKYGIETLSWQILEQSEDDDYLLNEREKFHILHNDSYYEFFGYNMTYGGQAGSNKFWYENLSIKEKELYIKKIKENLEKATNSEKRAFNMKQSWANDEKRKLATSKRTKKLWKDENHRKSVAKKISDVRKNDWANGKYDSSLLIHASNMARQKVCGSKWYNDTIKNYRLFEDDPKISELSLIKGRVSQGDKRRKNSKNKETSI